MNGVQERKIDRKGWGSGGWSTPHRRKQQRASRRFCRLLSDIFCPTAEQWTGQGVASKDLSAQIRDVIVLMSELWHISERKPFQPVSSSFSKGPCPESRVEDMFARQ